jgi:ring-1,2-phenylacetyl-CoA epoxidase subunit PaaE
MKFYTLRVIDIRFETSDSVTILFKQPGLKPITYLAGQYLSLIFRVNNRRYIRPYSFSSAPGVDKTLNITVKRVPGGIVSNHIIDKLKIDDVVEVMEPMGDFILNDNENKNDIYLWGAGSGITPLISIAKYAMHNNKAAYIHLAYGNRDYENVIFKNEIEDLEKKFSDVFFARHFITRPFIGNLNPSVIQSRVTAHEMRGILQQPKNKDRSGTSLHYICGPAGLKESVKSVLTEYGVTEAQIFSEDFEITHNPKDFDDIKTQYVSIKQGANSAVKVEVVAGKSILEAGLDALIDLSYSCQTGNCLVCRGRILNGDVKMIGITNLPKELGPDECLLCSSFPVSDNVEIEIE